jgi:hypothetical protein
MNSNSSTGKLTKEAGQAIRDYNYEIAFLFPTSVLASLIAVPFSLHEGFREKLIDVIGCCKILTVILSSMITIGGLYGGYFTLDLVLIFISLIGTSCSGWTLIYMLIFIVLVIIFIEAIDRFNQIYNVTRKYYETFTKFRIKTIVVILSIYTALFIELMILNPLIVLPGILLFIVISAFLYIGYIFLS